MLTKKNLVMYLILIIVLLLSSFIVLGTDTIFEKGSNISIKETCYNNGDYCSSNASCNLTVFNPENNLIVNNSLMTNNIYYHNYTINGNDVNISGDYRYNILCKDGVFVNSNSFNFLVTPSGTNPSSAQASLYIVLLIIAIVLFIGLLWIGFGIDGSNQVNDLGYVQVNYKKYVKFGVFTLSYVVLVWLFFLSWKISENFLFLEFTTTFFRMITLILLGVGGPLFIGIVIFLMILGFVKDSQLEKLSKRGLKPR